MAESTANGMASFSAHEKSTIRTERARTALRVSARLSRLPIKVYGTSLSARFDAFGLGNRLHLFGSLYHLNDLVIPSVTGGVAHLKYAFSLFYHCA